MRDDDFFYPSARMLENILIEPMAIGLRLYGSGIAGNWKLGRLERIYGQQDQSHDSLIKDYRGSWPRGSRRPPVRHGFSPESDCAAFAAPALGHSGWTYHANAVRRQAATPNTSRNR